MISYFKYFKKTITYLNRKKQYLFLGFILMGILTTIIMPVPIITGDVIDLLYKGDKVKIYTLMGLLLLIYFSKYILSILASVIFNKIKEIVNTEAKNRLLKVILNTSMDELNNLEKGELLSKFNECQQIQNFFDKTYINGLISYIEVIVMIFIIFKINITLSIIICLIIPIYFIFLKKSSKQMKELANQNLQSAAIVNGEIFEILNNIEKIKISNTKKLHSNEFSKKNKIFDEKLRKLNNSIAIFMENFALITNINNYLLLFCSIILFSNFNFSIGLYFSISMYSAKIFGGIQSISSLNVSLKPILSNIDRIEEFIQSKKVDNYPDKSAYISSIDTIDIRNISFGYKNNLYEDLTLKIDSGDIIYIEGANGSGKTTLMKLLLGIYYPNKGNILFNDIPMSELETNNLLGKIGYISKDIILVSGTIFDNLKYSNENLCLQDINNSIVEFELEKFIEYFDEGLNTTINKDRTGLSAGQIQIISFLRAVIGKKDLLILDEAFANLDQNARDEAIKLIKNKKIANIIIIISHNEKDLEFTNKTYSLSSLRRNYV